MDTPTHTAFQGGRRIAAGPPAAVAATVKAAAEAAPDDPILVFDDADARPVEFDLRGTPEEVAERAGRQFAATESEEGPAARRGPGRPRLGVIAREVTLLPRHWDWLARQPGGASVALRRLVDAARQANVGADRVRAAREAAYRFMAAMAGDRPHFEEVARALFAGDPGRFAAMIGDWPPDIAAHARRLAEPSFAAAG